MEIDSLPSVMNKNHDLEASEELLKQAKVDISKLKNQTQALKFAPTTLCGGADIRLVELNSDMLNHVESGGELVFRGDVDDFPVICTEEQTYGVREAETSNSLLLIPELQFSKVMPGSSDGRCLLSRTVVGIQSKYLELKAVSKMKTSRLRELLEECPFKGSDKENGSVGKKYCLSDLLDQIQGSSTEILQAISALPVCLIEGEYRWLDFDFLAHLLSELIDLLEEGFNDWKCFPIERLALVMQEAAPKSVLEKFFHMFGEPTSETDDNGIWHLREDRVCRFLAEVLLKPAKRFNFDDFMELWQNSVPLDMNVDLRQLEGLVILDDTGRIKTIEYFPVDDLPEEPQERFDHLFRHRQKWKECEILPYLQDLVTEKHSVGSLLTKFCRSSVVNGVRVYNTRESAFSRAK